MTEPGIARILVASLHQGIGDLLPARLEFYENWLNPEGLRQGTIGLAPVLAVLSFLRQEGSAYDAVTTRAGACAAEWTVASLSPVRRSILAAEPRWFRARSVLRLARRTIAGLHAGQRVKLRVRHGQARLDVIGSVFCGVREPARQPLCGFHAAAVTTFLDLFGVRADVRLEQCTAVGGASCVLDVAIGAREPEVASVVAIP